MINKFSMISVVIPSYNYEKYVEECISSIAKQTYSPMELVIVDDCSTDNSVLIIDEFIQTKLVRERFENIVFLRNSKNMGAHYTINRGVSTSKGKYIAIINADDMYESNRFKCMIELLKSKHARIAFSGVEVIDEFTQLLHTDESSYFCSLPTKAIGNDKLCYELMNNNIAVSTGNLLFEKALYEELHGFRKYKYIHDWDFILRALLLTEPVVTLDTHYYYRLHRANSFRSLQNIADLEVDLVLSDFFGNVRLGKFKNPLINSSEIHDYISNIFLQKHWKNANKLIQIWLKTLYLIRRKL